MSSAYLLIGGNKGNRLKYLRSAVVLISQRIGNIIRSSSIYATEPYGFRDRQQFLNICVLVETTLSPHSILDIILQIETTLGRKRKPEKYVSRSIDIDILFYDDIMLQEPSLIIPHPELHKRNFTLIPMAEVSPGFIHPVLGKTISKLLEESSDTHKVVLYRDLLF